MQSYYVFRKGANSANQPREYGPVHVATVKAETEQEACALAAKRVTVYFNQHLYAELASVVDAREKEVDERVQVVDGE